MGEVEQYLQEAMLAFDRGILPMAAAGGTGEVYVLYNTEHEPLGVFKTGSSAEALCEQISYALDYKGFAGIPKTMEMTLPCPWFKELKRGSFQCFAGSGLVLGHYPSKDNSKIAASEVRKIAILDIRLLNSDRHEYNLIYEDGVLIPIDHGHVLSESCTTSFRWQEWPQVFTPFSEVEKSYIRSLNPLNDYTLLLERFQLSKKRASILYLSTIFLQNGMECGLTIGEIGSLMELRCYSWLSTPTNLFRQLWDELQDEPMHLWDKSAQELMEQLYTCI